MTVWQNVHPTNAQFFRNTGALFFNYTAAAASDTPNDIFFGSVPGTASTGDYFAIGWTAPFEAATLTVSTLFVGVSGFIWQYWNGSSWTALADVVDGTAGFTILGAVDVTWTVPDDWEQNEVNGTIAYHVRVLWSPWTSTTTAPRGSLVSVQGLTSDPVYGDNPIDPLELWNATFRPPLIPDPYWTARRNVVTQMVRELLEAQWLTLWRRSIVTAVGAQLEARGDELAYPQPVGWTDDRWRAVLIALLPASLARMSPEVVYDLATALLDTGQTFTALEEFPCSARFTYYETDQDDAIAYITALDRARPRGCQYYLVSHPGGGADPFTIDTSQIDGPDTLGDMWWTEDF